MFIPNSQIDFSSDHLKETIPTSITMFNILFLQIPSTVPWPLLDPPAPIHLTYLLPVEHEVEPTERLHGQKQSRIIVFNFGQIGFFGLKSDHIRPMLDPI
ncbi:hypothetical protein E2542_SST13726 [Spatholobus suberectus]|nr:hypothetical protein E2542_SST13726 [Spatholobus suberectus]